MSLSRFSLVPALAGLALMVPFAAFSASSPTDVQRIVPDAASRVRFEKGLAQPKVMGNQTYPGSPQANPLRTYPPSCAADPLPNKASGPVLTGTVPLYTFNATTGADASIMETVTVTVWRLACSSSGSSTPYNPRGYRNAMTLIRFDRSAANDNRTDIYPMLPIVRASQNNSSLTGQASWVRIAAEPNTVVSEAAPNTPLINSTTYVLENYPYRGFGYFTFSDAFKLRIDPMLTRGSGGSAIYLDLTVPNYGPTESTYPDAYGPLPIDGYMSGNWYDPAHSGEGIVIDVAEQQDAQGKTTRMFVYDWYTYGSNGMPFWLAGTGMINAANPLSVVADTGYRTGGGFAGNFGAQLPATVWGKVTFKFIDCNTIEFTYQSTNNSLPAGVPTGAGTRTWKRLSNVNGMTCE